MTTVPLLDTPCLFCARPDDEIMYPELLPPGSLSAQAFSARRTNRRREHFRIVRCRGCGLVRSSPVPGAADLARLYMDSGYEFSAEAPYAAETYGTLVDALVARHAPGRPPASLLEVGCSTGFFLQQALARGIPDVTGFEPSSACVRHAPENLRARIINDIYRPQALSGRTFAMAASFHVLDHLLDPAGFLRSLRENLSRQGWVLLACHDVASWSARLFGGASPIFDVEHVYLFSAQTLRRLLESTGYEVLECGSLRNRYPLGYWMRMLSPALARLLPGAVQRVPVSLHAGNLYYLARVGEESGVRSQELL